MASCDDSSQDSSTKKVLDYYAKYSQNSNLSKYFSGSSIQYLPVIDIPTEEKDQNTVKLIANPNTSFTKFPVGKLLGCKDSTLNIKKNNEMKNSDDDNLNVSLQNSPIQSPSDNKKLEWDSGADIGYHNIQSNPEKKPLRKCLSLPILDNMQNTKFNLIAPHLNTSPENNSNVFIFISTTGSTSSHQKSTENSKSDSDATTDNHLTQVTGSKSSSSSSYKSKTTPSQETSSNSKLEDSKLSDFTTTLSYLKTKIGLPGAHSTPNIEGNNNGIVDNTKSTASTSKTSSSKHVNYKEVKFIGTSHIDNFSDALPAVKKGVKMLTKDQNLQTEFEKELISLTNIQKLDNNPKKVMKMLSRKVVELTISEPVSLNWACPGTVANNKIDGDPRINFDHEPKAIQIEDIFKQGAKPNDILSKKHQSTLPSENEVANILEDSSNCSSNCDSFEYIGSTADIKSTKQKEPQSDQNKNDFSITRNSKCQTILDNAETRSSQYKDSSLSSSGSITISEDIEKHVDLLQKLLKSKKVHLNKKKYYIRKLINNISEFDCLESTPSNFCLNNDSYKKGGVDEKPVVSSLESSCTGKDKRHLQRSTKKQTESDYLLQFAENERAYQINWIENEISHLTKLKSILEPKKSGNPNKRKIDTSVPQTQSSKTSVYKIVEKDGTGKNSHRDYVIQTRLDAKAGQPGNYCLQGKKYSVINSKIPNTSSSNEALTGSSVSADIKVKTKENQTNIKVTKFCRTCDQESYVCRSDKLEDDLTRTKNNTAQQCNPSQLDFPEIVSKICHSCNKLTCICQEEEPIRLILEKEDHNTDSSSSQPCICQEEEPIRPILEEEDHNSGSSSFRPCICKKEELIRPILEKEDHNSGSSSSRPDVCKKEEPIRAILEKEDHNSDSSSSRHTKDLSILQEIGHEDFNSLQKIFQKCGCTVKNRECTCLFVKKLFDKFLSNENLQVSDDVCTNVCAADKVKDDVVFKSTECQTSPLSNKNKKQFIENGFQTELFDVNLTALNPNSQSSSTECQTSPISNKNKKQFIENGFQTELFDVNLKALNPNSQSSSNQQLRSRSNIISEKDNQRIRKENSIMTMPSKVDTGSSSLNLKSKINVQDNDTLLAETEHSNEDPNKIMNKRDILEKFAKKSSSELKIDSVVKDIGVQASVSSKNYSQQTSVQYLEKQTSFDRQFNKINDHGKNELYTQKESLTDNVANGISDEKIEARSLVSKPSKKVDSSHSQQLTVPNVETTSDGTSANYSQAGSTSTSISTSVLDSQHISSSKLRCICCRKKAVVAEVSNEKNGNTSNIVCSRCYYNQPMYYFNNFHHQHMCLRHQGNTTQNHANCHSCCKCYKHKLRNLPKVPQGLWYTLTVQEPTIDEEKRPIELGVNETNNKINGNNKENRHRSKNKLHVDQSKNDKQKERKKKDNDMPQTEAPKENKIQYTLREYLNMNRPEFVYSAENRRQTVLSSRILREYQKNTLKLHFLENNLQSKADSGQYKLFTEREMKNITKKNYAKLPEVQHKLTSVRERRLRDADKLICDIFTKKVQKSALKGKWNFPIDKTLTNM